MSIGALTEPRVLASAKDHLSQDTEKGYAVVDSQFQQSRWGKETITEELRHRLQPINSLPMGNGYPDALIAPPRSEAYRDPAGESVESIPLAVVEAKGETASSNRNAGRVAITQAHGHLEEANIGYAALPKSIATEQDHALARELNIGLILVDDVQAELVEKPRIVGSETSETADTIRFHAKLGGVAVESLKKNHPKNAIGYALAVRLSEDTEEVFKEYVIKSVDDARLDATVLGLVGDGLDRRQLTTLGREAVRTITYHHGGVVPALEAIQEQTGCSARFIDELPVMGTVARQVLLTYPPTQVLVNTLTDFAEEGYRKPSLARVAKAIARDRPDFALDLFVSPGDRDAVLEGSASQGQVNLEKFEGGSIYSTHTTFQYKAMLYHVGLLTKRGHDRKSDLNPQTAVWALENTNPR
jgi:hypothetical protein